MSVELPCCGRINIHAPDCKRGQAEAQLALMETAEQVAYERGRKAGLKERATVIDAQRDLIHKLDAAIVGLVTGKAVACTARGCTNGKLMNYEIDGASTDPPDPVCGLCNGTGQLAADSSALREVAAATMERLSARIHFLRSAIKDGLNRPPRHRLPVLRKALDDDKSGTAYKK